MILALFNVMRKEMIQTLRDRKLVFMLLAAPVIQLVMFGFAVDMDVDHIPAVVCDEDGTEASRALADAFVAEGTFRRLRDVRRPDEAQAALESGDASAALLISRGYAVRAARRDDPQVGVLLDGTDATRAEVAAADATQFLALHGIGVGAANVRALATAPPVVPRILYNPRLKTPIYMVPGILASLLLNITAIITAMGLAREREAGTLEQVLVTPVGRSVLLAGKCIPFILFGLVDVMAVLLVGSWLFDVPMRGGFGVIGLGAFLYLFSTLGIGILIAAFSSSQQEAMLGSFAFMLPTMLLSGFMSPISSMPAWLQPLTMLIPMRHFLEIMRAALLKGAGAADLVRQLLALTVLGVVILGVSVVRFSKRLV
jgi:drug efflux transport system permease protein